jgi:hypothetical protein
MKTSTCIIALVLWIPIALALLTVKPQRAAQEQVADVDSDPAESDAESAPYLPEDQTFEPDDTRASGG